MMKGIYYSNGSYGIRWWDKEQKKMVHGGRYPTQQEAADALTKRTSAEDVPLIKGPDVFKYDASVADRMWEMAAEVYEKNKKDQVAKKSQSIHLGNKPTGIAFLSDLHLGNSGTDYGAIFKDTKLVADTPGMYAAFHGDGIDNWITPKLQSLQRNQAVSFQTELMLFRRWLELIQEKLLLVVSGNHDNWTSKISGVDIIPSLLESTTILYDPNEIYVDISCGSYSWNVLIRHKWKYSSIFNPTHGIEVGFDRLSRPFDIGIGGHTHIGTLFRPFYRHGEERLALLTGAYKRIDSFSKEIGYAETANNGCGAIIFMPDGKMWYNSDLEVACNYLTYLRGER
jgi:hypothetical protein